MCGFFIFFSSLDFFLTESGLSFLFVFCSFTSSLFFYFFSFPVRSFLSFSCRSLIFFNLDLCSSFFSICPVFFFIFISVLQFFSSFSFFYLLCPFLFLLLSDQGSRQWLRAASGLRAGLQRSSTARAGDDGAMVETHGLGSRLGATGTARQTAVWAVASTATRRAR